MTGRTTAGFGAHLCHALLNVILCCSKQKTGKFVLIMLNKVDSTVSQSATQITECVCWVSVAIWASGGNCFAVVFRFFRILQFSCSSCWHNNILSHPALTSMKLTVRFVSCVIWSNRSSNCHANCASYGNRKYSKKLKQKNNFMINLEIR